MLGDAEKLTNFPLHLVDIKDVNPIFSEYIKKNGKLVYERKK